MNNWATAVILFLLVGFSCSAGSGQLLPLSSHPDTQGWQDLLAEDLSNCQFREETWVLEEGVLTRKGGDYIWTKDRYGDFILDLEYKLEKGANSGVFVRTGSIRNWLNTAIEVQIHDTTDGTKYGMCGAIYDCLAPTKDVTKPAGQWNRLTITCKKNKIYVLMNGEQIIDMDLDMWTEAGRNPDGTKNKFRTAYRDMSREGHIGFQDHGDPVWFRYIKIKPLPEGIVEHPDTDYYDGWRLATQAYSFNRYTFFEAIDKTAALGLDRIEAYPGQRLSPEHPGAGMVHTMSADLRRAVKEKLKDAGIKLINYGVVSLPNDEARCREVFDFAREMGIETIVSEPPEEAFEMIDKLCQEYRIKVAIHNHPRPSHYWNPETVLKACAGRSKWIGACADTGHWVRSDLDPLECLKKLEGRIISLHFKEIDEGHDVIWGTGPNRATALLEELHRQKFRGVFSIEYEYHWTTSLPEIRGCVEYFNEAGGKLNPTGWRDLIKPDMSNCVYKEGGWTYKEGELSVEEHRGDFFIKEKFGDFILDVEFKVPPQGNSGVVIRSGVIGNTDDWLHEAIEVQVYDTYGRAVNKNCCGSIYDCLAPSKNMAKPAGQWNHFTITCIDNKIYIVMNGEQIIDMDLDLWTVPGRNPDGGKNKFKKAYKDMARTGYIGFQEHGDEVWYRNLKIKPLQ